MEIIDGTALAPISPDWAGVVRWVDDDSGRDGFILGLYSFKGTELFFGHYDTLEIALDHGWDLTDVPPSDWEACHLEITDPDGRILWHSPDVD